MTQNSNHAIIETDDGYMMKIHKYKMSIILMKKMLKNKMISDIEYENAVKEIKKIYQIPD